MHREEYIFSSPRVIPGTSVPHFFTVGFRSRTLFLTLDRTRVAITGLYPRDVGFTPPPSFLPINSPHKGYRPAADVHGPRCWGHPTTLHTPYGMQLRLSLHFDSSYSSWSQGTQFSTSTTIFSGINAAVSAVAASWTHLLCPHAAFGFALFRFTLLLASIMPQFSTSTTTFPGINAGLCSRSPHTLCPRWEQLSGLLCFASPYSSRPMDPVFYSLPISGFAAASE